MRNLYSLTKGRQAIRAFTRAMPDEALAIVMRGERKDGAGDLAA